ncbi:TonB-dependent receptor [Pseudoduganella sp. GCM10020061]|uniref:TonB-dependent receptor n=1 Tax=Pseudoduganella sp. GCM10020061 TaxID=3317345 RepID=UPI00363A6051
MYHRTLIAGAVLSTLAPLTQAQSAHSDIQQVVVTATPFRSGEGDQILTPAKVLSGNELRDKVGATLGETLSQELGVSASAFGAGASRPIIRGLEGSRVKMLENGMAVSDVSGLSNDHAVAAEGATAVQIEILRGPASLLYGSGAIGGLVNVVNERIPTALEPKPFGHMEARLGTVDRSRNLTGSADTAVGSVALHVDSNFRITDDYKFPGTQVAGDASSATGRLPNSATRSGGGGFGGSYVKDWGYIGASVSTLDNLYGIPTEEAARIDMKQRRYDASSLVKNPFDGFKSLQVKLGYSDYEHAELEPDNTPAIRMKNRAVESRWELTHNPVAGFSGTFGMQSEHSNYSALSAEEGHGHANTVPRTKSASTAAFLVEEKSFGPVRMSAGLRLETVERKPETGMNRKFDLTSYSIGGQWRFMPGYAAGVTGSVAQRAPATEELYSEGPHEATATFDIGNPNFRKETSRNIELTMQKTTGLVRWKANLFQNDVKDFIYGDITGNLLDDEGNPGDELRERIFAQADATIRGAEAELTINETGQGWSGRLFADRSRGTLDHGGSLPLQPADRVGATIGWKSSAWRAGVSLVHGMEQDRLARHEESRTPSYNQLSANLSYTQHLGTQDLTWFVLAKNLLNEQIRTSTSVLKDVAPLPGRSLVFGVRSRF